MTIDELFTLYPNGRLQPKEAPEPYLSLPINNHYFVLETTELTMKELHLLKALFFETHKAVNAQAHPWYGHLFEAIPLEIDTNVRILQIYQKKPKDFFLEEWQRSIQEIFPTALDCFFFTEYDGALIEEYAEHPYSLEELNSIFLTLDADFDTSTIVFAGSFFPTNKHLVPLFQEERQIFMTEKNEIKKQTAFSLTNVALHYYTKKAMHESLIIDFIHLKKKIPADMHEIIRALWKYQGNISSAAKDLYLHRNTLHYRLDKFHDQTGWSLKVMDDLVFCYLLITQ